MENRYKLSKTHQKQFILNVEKYSGLKGDELAKRLGVVGRSYRDWKRGKFALPENAINIIEKEFRLPFPYSKQKALQKWKNDKSKGSRRGGLAAFRKYGSPGTLEGRRKGGQNALAKMRKLGIISVPKPFYYPKTYNSKLAEFVGILLGDGHIGKDQWTITLNSKKDKQYSLYVKSLVQSLFKFNPCMWIRRDCHVIMISGSGIKSIEYFKNIGLKVGNKVKQQVEVPSWIINNRHFSIECLRGLVDTDGGIFTHCYKVKGKKYSYEKLSFVNRSVPLLTFVFNTLKNEGFTPKIIDRVENKRVWLYNHKEVKRYLKDIRSHNSRLFNKFI